MVLTQNTNLFIFLTPVKNAPSDIHYQLKEFLTGVKKNYWGDITNSIMITISYCNVVLDHYFWIKNFKIMA